MSYEEIKKPARARQADTSERYLAFLLGKEQYAIPLLQVKEVIEMSEPTPIPQTPSYFKGVINLRGKVIPVVDLRLKFGMAEMVYSSRTCIIVTEVEGESGPMMIGAVVDGVSEVLNLVAADIEDTPDFGGEVSTTGLLGMAKVKGKVKILLDIDQVMTQQDLKELGKIFS